MPSLFPREDCLPDHGNRSANERTKQADDAASQLHRPHASFRQRFGSLHLSPHPSFLLFSSVSRSFTMTFSFSFSSSPSISCSASPMCGMYLSM